MTSPRTEWLLSKKTQVTNTGKDMETKRTCALMMEIQIGVATVENRTN